MNESLLVAGSIALDTLDGPFGHVTDELGGSALYFALAASLIVPVQLMAPVGAAEAGQVKAAVGSRPIDTTFLQVLDARTFRWRAHQEDGRNVDLGRTRRCLPGLTDGLLSARFDRTVKRC